MLGGRIIGEGVDGCVFTEPMWPCASNSNTQNSIPNTRNQGYVSKIVPIKDKESRYLKMAARILGSDLSSKYISSLKGECKPAGLIHKPRGINENSFSRVQENIKGYKKIRSKGVCSELDKDLQSTSDKYKIMYISRYSMAVDQWIKNIKKTQQPYSTLLPEVEKAIPTLLDVLQRLFQGDTEQLVHIDLHTGNLFVKLSPLEFGIADFGHCLSRRYDVDQSVSFYGEYLNDFIGKYVIYTGEYSQTPFESRLLNFCYKKGMDNVSPSTLITQWVNDTDVRSFSDTRDIISKHMSVLLKYLLHKPLFIAMVESLQSISRKLRAHPSDPIVVVKSLSSIEKTVLDYTITRYSIISPLITITREIMSIYPDLAMFTQDSVGTSKLIRFIKKAILAPYDQDTLPLESAIKAIYRADLRILWQMTV